MKSIIKLSTAEFTQTVLKVNFISSPTDYTVFTQSIGTP